MSFPRYDKYKDSGVEWLGEVPEHWEVDFIKYLASINDEVLSEATPEDFEINYVDISSVDPINGIIHKENLLFKNSPSRARRIVRDGDSIVSTVRTYLKAIAPIIEADNNLIVSTGFAVIRPQKIDPQFSSYILRSSYFIDEVISHSVGVSYPAINATDIGLIKITCPTMVEQKQIAIFLDRETAKIDDLIAEQQKLIELLKEKRQAVISHAVTKGLNPDAKMKDSGIEWLGEVPEHWEIVPFSLAIDFQEGPGILAIDFCDEGVPLLRVSGVQGGYATLEGCNYLNPEKVTKRWEHFKLKRGDLLISASASMGTVCEVDIEAEGAIPYTGLIRLSKKNDRIIKSYIRDIVRSFLFFTQIDLFKAGATIQHFGPTHLSQMKILLPSLDEQKKISFFIDTETSKLDTLISEAQKAITLLHERRTALISAAVTGKIDVRGFVPDSENGVAA